MSEENLAADETDLFFLSFLPASGGRVAVPETTAPSPAGLSLSENEYER